MNTLTDDVTLILIKRDGTQTEERMKRYLAEAILSTVAREQPDIASARIEKRGYSPVERIGAQNPYAMAGLIARVAAGEAVTFGVVH